MLGYLLSRLFPPPIRHYRIHGIDIHSFPTNRQFRTTYPEDTPHGSISLLHETRTVDCNSGVYCSDCPGGGPVSCYHHITTILSRPVYRRRRR